MRDDHECPTIQRTNRGFICHQHNPSVEMSTAFQLEQHLKEHSQIGLLSLLQLACPVCHSVSVNEPFQLLFFQVESVLCLGQLYTVKSCWLVPYI